MNTAIKFKRLVASPMYGNCGPGDILRCSEAFARHCVQDLSAAEYLTANAPPTAAPVAPVKRRKKANSNQEAVKAAKE